MQSTKVTKVLAGLVTLLFATTACGSTENAVRPDPVPSTSSPTAAPSARNTPAGKGGGVALGANGLPEYVLSLLGPSIYWDVKGEQHTTGNPFENVYRTAVGTKDQASESNRPAEGLDITFVGKANATAGPGAYFAKMVGGKGHATNFGSVNDLDVPEPPTNMYFAACGPLYVMGAVSDTCIGVANRGLSYNFWLGGPQWSAKNTSEACNSTLGICLRYDASGTQDNAVEVSGIGCRQTKNGQLATSSFGCIYPQNERTISSLLARNCKNQHECQVVGFVNGAADLITGTESQPKPMPGASGFGTVQLCTAATQDMVHGDVAGLVGTPYSPYLGVILRSDGSWTSGGDTRIEGSVRVTWTTKGDCRSPDGSAIYKVNWDSRSRNKNEVAKQACESQYTDKIQHNGHTESLECQLMFTRVKYDGYQFGEPQTWENSTFMQLVSTMFMSFFNSFFDVPGGDAAGAGIREIYQIATMQDNTLYTTNLITARQT